MGINWINIIIILNFLLLSVLLYFNNIKLIIKLLIVIIYIVLVLIYKNFDNIYIFSKSFVVNLRFYINLDIIYNLDFFSNDKFFIFYLILFFFLSILLLSDKRFLLNRKIIFIILNIILLIISIFINKMPYKILIDLFWYSQILMTSFIFHILFLSRIFNILLNKKYEYLGFIISRISYIFSIWNVLNILRITSEQFIPRNQWFILNYFQNNFECHKKDYESIKKYRIFYILWIILIFIRIILLNFSLVFHNYSLLLLGKNEKIRDYKIIIKIILVFIIFVIISIILQIPRLYIIWVICGIIEIYKIIKLDYIYFSNDVIYKEKIKCIKNRFNKLNFLEIIVLILNHYFYIKWFNLYFIIYQKDIYNKFFFFEIEKFIIDKYKKPCFIYISINLFEELWYKQYWENMEFPIKKIYKFYSLKELAIGYSRIRNKVNPIFLEEKNWEFTLRGQKFWSIEKIKEDIRVGLNWCKLINEKSKFLWIIYPWLKKYLIYYRYDKRIKKVIKIMPKEEKKKIKIWLRKQIKKDMNSYKKIGKIKKLYFKKL